MAGASIGRGRGGIVGINMTPMVDIMLVLLVIMMVSANFIVSQTMNVDLPKAASGERSPPALAVVSIQADGRYGFNDVPISDGAFQFIEAFNAAQITVGCNISPPKFCPDDNVTRRQMAVFFAKALGLYWAY